MGEDRTGGAARSKQILVGLPFLLKISLIMTKKYRIL